ncbi:MAG: ImmA/IrrE family metallo-endopeptidase [Alphaproteobacteria bacterium]
MNDALTPGQLVRNAMNAKGWGERDLAFAIGTAPNAINQILNDRRSISHSMARALGVALERPAEDFARAQAEWDLRRTDEPDPRISARARILSRYPLREMVKRGWIDPDHRPGTLEEQVCQFFGVASLDDVPHLEHSAKKSDYSALPPAQLAWLFRVRQIAKEMHPPPYSEEKLREAIDVLKEMRTDPEGVRHVPRLLNDAGVRYVVAEGLPGGLIDGVCFWLGPNTPVIGMSLRFDRIDNFWFVLRHECAHVLHGHGKGQAIVDEDMEAKSLASDNEEERIANTEAADFCVPAESMRSFYLRKNPFFSESDVLAFSKRMKVHPGLAVGQLQRLAKRYDLLRKHLVRVRSYLAGSMMMDGWGDVVPVGR